MFRRAMAIFAFSVFLVSYATPPIPQPDSFPDLIITNLFLNSQRKLIVTISNNGSSPLPLGRGSLKE